MEAVDSQVRVSAFEEFSARRLSPAVGKAKPVEPSSDF